MRVWLCLFVLVSLAAALPAPALKAAPAPVVKVNAPPPASLPPAADSVTAGIRKIQFSLDGKDITPPDGLLDGGLPDALDYNGTIYVPLRFVSRALGVPLRWNPATQTISLGASPAVSAAPALPPRVVTPAALSAPAAYLSELRPASRQALKAYEAIIADNSSGNPASGAYWKPPMKIAGQVYRKGISFQLFNGSTSQLAWRLDGKYAALETVLGLDAQSDSMSLRDRGAYQRTAATVTFSGDGRTLAVIVIGASTTPSRVRIPLSGVKSLTVRVAMQTDRNNLAMLDMADPALK